MKKKPRAKSPQRVKKTAPAHRARPGRPLRIVDAINRAGRPNTYVAQYAHVAGVMAQSGATEFEIAMACGVTQQTLIEWKSRNPELAEALKSGKERSKERVEHALFHRAVGYTHEATKIVTIGKQVVAVQHLEHYAPDTGAICFYLKNADPVAYKDRHEVTASVHQKRSEIDLTDEELLEAIRREEAARPATK